MAEFGPRDTLKAISESCRREREQKEQEERQQIICQSTPPPTQHQYCEHPDALGNGMATAFYIATMIGGAIFNDRWLIWIVATILWLSYICKHEY